MKDLSDEQIIDLKNFNHDKNDALLTAKKNTQDNNTEKKDEKNKYPQNNSLEWRASEFYYFAKSKLWFIVMFFITAIVEFYFIISGDFFAFATFLLIFFVLFLYAVKKPRILSLKINNRGAYIDGKLYEFGNMKSFWISYEPPEIKKIYFKKNETLYTDLILPLGGQDPVIARNFLKKYLPEEKKEESLLEVFVRKIRF